MVWVSCVIASPFFSLSNFVVLLYLFCFVLSLVLLLFLVLKLYLEIVSGIIGEGQMTFSLLTPGAVQHLYIQVN